MWRAAPRRLLRTPSLKQKFSSNLKADPPHAGRRRGATHFGYRREDAVLSSIKVTHYVHRQSGVPWKDLVLWGGAATLAGATAVYVGSCMEPVAITGRQRIMLLDAEDEIELGKTMVAAIDREKLVPRDDPVVVLVQRVADRLIPQVEALGITYDWQIFVVQDDEINAFCAPTGKIVFYTGLLEKIAEWVDEKQLPDMEAGIAAVMAHEIAHAVARHVAENFSINPLVMIPAKLLAYESPLLDRILGWGINFGLELPMSRAFELEADLIGMHLMARACYDPRFAPQLFELLDDGAGLSMYLSTHPNGALRIERCNANLPECMAELCSTCVVGGSGGRSTGGGGGGIGGATAAYVEAPQTSYPRR